MSMNSDLANLSPTETARRFGVTVKALRLYESRGLLTPVRSESGWRTYGPDQIARLHQILALKRLGLSLASIGQLMASADTLDSVLALQDQALVQDGKRIAKGLALVRAARAKLKTGQALSIDDLATLSKETSMTSKLTRPTLFHPAFVPHQHKYFLPEELEALAAQDGFDQEADIAIWEGLIADLKMLTGKDDPASPAARDLGRRWLAQTESFTKGDEILTTKLRNMTKDAFADPVTAQQMPYSKEHLIFLGMIFAGMSEQPRVRAARAGRTLVTA
jgi:MerR family transcriptional regulator, thiopeptide resistance regulator